jgi:GNAT superfamily N-acetyltransferase
MSEGISEIKYRSAVRTDAAAIIEFQIAMALETEDVVLDRAICTKGVNEVFDDPSHGRYFVCEKDGRVISSTMITYEWSDWRHGVVWWIQSVYVIPEMRGRGVYAGLYAYIQDLARHDESVRGIRLYVDRRNTTAQKVYTRLGMDGEHYLVYEWMK